FLFNDTPTTEIYTLSLHDALPISALKLSVPMYSTRFEFGTSASTQITGIPSATALSISAWKSSGRAAETQIPVGCCSTIWRNIRSEEHTSELQSRGHLVCRLLLEK